MKVYSVLVLTSIILPFCQCNPILRGRAEVCEKKKWCETGTWGSIGNVRRTTFDPKYVLATYVKIFPDEVDGAIKKGAVENFENLATIYAENVGITAIEWQAFHNLPALRSIYLAFNSLREICLYNVFSRLPVAVLDLSWNKINLVESYAFGNDLKVLNLSHNELIRLDLGTYGTWRLKELVVAHNLLEDVFIRYNVNVTSMDFSFNRLDYFFVRYNALNKMYKKIDLSNNFLSTLDWTEGSVEDLRLSLNNLTDVDVLLSDKTFAKRITLFPNPWDCAKVEMLLKNLIERKVTILDPSIDKRFDFTQSDYPICAIPNQEAYHTYDVLRGVFIERELVICNEDSQCPDSMICRTGTCWDPCKNNACKSGSKVCETKNHTFTCKCPSDQLSPPYEPLGQCYFP